MQLLLSFGWCFWFSLTGPLSAHGPQTGGKFCQAHAAPHRRWSARTISSISPASPPVKSTGLPSCIRFRFGFRASHRRFASVWRSR